VRAAAVPQVRCRARQQRVAAAKMRATCRGARQYARQRRVMFVTSQVLMGPSRNQRWTVRSAYGVLRNRPRLSACPEKVARMRATAPLMFLRGDNPESAHAAPAHASFEAG